MNSLTLQAITLTLVCLASDARGQALLPDTQELPSPTDASEQPPPSTYDQQRALSDEPMSEPRTLTGQLVRTVLALGFVVGLIYLIFKVGLARLLRSSGFGGTPAIDERQLRVVGRKVLDTKNSLYLVTIGEHHRVLLGSGERGITMLGRFDDSYDEPHSTQGVEESLTFRQVLDEPSERGPHEL